MDIAIMIEGQNGLNWPRWQRIARAVEDLGFAGLYRSDHFTNANPPDLDSLELWTSLTWLASHTTRIEFGPLVTPVSFRHPVFSARMGMQVDELSGGRFTLGLGAGWQEREHTKFGFDLLELRNRFVRFREGLEVATRLLRSDEPVSYSGTFYHLNEAVLLPRPTRTRRPPILVGGNGLRRTLALAARYADEWNAVYVPPARFAELNQRLDGLVRTAGRDPRAVRRSLMTGCVFGRTDADVQRNLKGRDANALLARGVILGTPAQAVDQLRQVDQAGVQRVMLQWLDLDDLDGVEALAKAVLPVWPRHRR
jgi:F420-dependent oxidoreductase-like protein